MSNQSYTSKIVRGGAIIFVSNMVVAILGYLHRFMLSQKLSVEDFGLFYAVLGFGGLFMFLLSLGLDQVVVKYTKLYTLRGDKINQSFLIFITSFFKLIATLAVVGMVYLFKDFIVYDFFKSTEVIYGIKLLMIYMLLFPIATMNLSVLNGLNRFKILSSITLLQWVLVVIGTYYLSNLDSFFEAYFIAGMIIAIVGFIIVVGLGSISIPSKWWDAILIKEYFAYGVPVFLAMFATNLIMYEDTVLLTYFSSIEQVALYNIAMPTASIIWTLASAILMVLFSFFVEINEKDSHLLQNGIRQVYKYVSIAFVPLVFLFLVFGDLFINLLFGAEYLEATPILYILVISSLFVVMYQISITIINSVLKPIYFTRYIYMSVILGTILNLIIIPIYGAIGAAISFLVMYMCMYIFAHRLINQHLHTSISFMFLGKLISVGLIITLIIYYVNQLFYFDMYIKAVLLFILYMILYVAVLYWFKIVTKQEIQQLWKLI